MCLVVLGRYLDIYKKKVALAFIFVSVEKCHCSSLIIDCIASAWTGDRFILTALLRSS